MLKILLKKGFHVFRILVKVRWIKTLRVNFGLLPFEQAIKLPILITGKLIIDSLKGKVIFHCPIKFGLVLMGKDLDNMPIASVPSRLRINGTLIFKGKCIITQSANITVWNNATIELGSYVIICSGVLLKSADRITIGEYTRLTSGCFVMDTNVHAMKNVETGIIKRPFSSIEIGKCCWITMYTSIMAGTKIPDYCITGRYSLLNKDYTKICKPASMLVGTPAKVVAEGIQRLSDINYELNVVNKYFIEHPQENVFQGEIGFEKLTEESVKSHFII